MDLINKKAYYNEVFEALQTLEDALFGDMLLVDYPNLTTELDKRGLVAVVPIIDYVGFSNVRLLPNGSDSFGEYDHKARTLAVECDEDGMIDLSNLAHEMIHHYEESIREMDEGVLQLLAIDLYRKLEGRIPNLREMALEHIELAKHRDIENEGGRHSLLFYLKSLDVDDMLELPLNTTMGYGYPKITTNAD